jgi:hypothetical protein
MKNFPQSVTEAMREVLRGVIVGSDNEVMAQMLNAAFAEMDQIGMAERCNNFQWTDEKQHKFATQSDEEEGMADVLVIRLPKEPTNG